MMVRLIFLCDRIRGIVIFEYNALGACCAREWTHVTGIVWDVIRLLLYCIFWVTNKFCVAAYFQSPFNINN